MAEHAPEVETQERGDIFFLYRPKVEHEEAHGLDDVERFHMVLRPEGRRLWRLIVLGRKRLPDVDAHARHWGFVDKVAHTPDKVREAFGPLSYHTKTRGKRHVAAARPAGEGVYALVRDGAGLHLAYRLELPRDPGPVQRALGIEAEAVYALSIKNPEAPGAALLGEGRARLPRAQQRLFRGRRYEAENVAPLDHEGIEVLLTGEGRDAGTELPQGHAGSDLLRLLPPGRDRVGTEPLLEGVWA